VKKEFSVARLTYYSGLSYQGSLGLRSSVPQLEEIESYNVYGAIYKIDLTLSWVGTSLAEGNMAGL
jgi:hypothetical protein